MRMQAVAACRSHACAYVCTRILSSQAKNQLAKTFFNSNSTGCFLIVALLVCCRVRLCDFGCARRWDTKHVPERRLGRFSTFAGTPAYMSPQVSLLCGPLVLCW